MTKTNTGTIQIPDNNDSMHSPVNNESDNESDSGNESDRTVKGN